MKTEIFLFLNIEILISYEIFLIFLKILNFKFFFFVIDFRILKFYEIFERVVSLFRHAMGCFLFGLFFTKH
jgi:hypothetical protein